MKLLQCFPLLAHDYRAGFSVPEKDEKVIHDTLLVLGADLGESRVTRDERLKLRFCRDV